MLGYKGGFPRKIQTCKFTKKKKNALDTDIPPPHFSIKFVFRTPAGKK